MDQERKEFRRNHGCTRWCGDSCADRHLPSTASKRFPVKNEAKTHTGLYRDDGLIYIEGASGPLISRIEKTLNRIVKSNKLSIRLEQKGQVVNFLDVTLDIDGTHKPYKKKLTARSRMLRKQTNFIYTLT